MTATTQADQQTIRTITPADTRAWAACMDIYSASFPEWEREPEARLVDGVRSGRYVMRAAMEKNVQLGLTCLDVDRAEDIPYALLMFLAVAQPARGRGLARLLIEDAVDWAFSKSASQWCLTEAEPEPAKLYQHLGFKTMDLPYAAPSFTDETSVPMALMAIPRDRATATIDGNSLHALVARIYTSGYGLSVDDPRLVRQLEVIDQDVRLI